MPRLLRIPPSHLDAAELAVEQAEAAKADVLARLHACYRDEVRPLQEQLAAAAERGRLLMVEARRLGIATRTIADATMTDTHPPVSPQTVSNQVGKAGTVVKGTIKVGPGGH